MKISKISAGLLVLASMLPLPMRADETAPKDPVKDPYKTIIIREPRPKNRPEAPSRVYIECRYGAGFMWFQLPAGVYQATLRLSNDTFVWEGLVTTDNPMVEIPSLTGEYTLLCQTDNGRLFTGLLEF